jgi:hypothetical protein
MIAKTISSSLQCAIDIDCPPGYICHEGRCMPATQ